MADTVWTFCTHAEQVGPAQVPMLHQFRSRPAATQRVLVLGGDAWALRQGDRFENESIPDHRAPRSGPFVRTPDAAGAFVEAGQALLVVAGRPAVVRGGRLDICCEIEPRRPCAAAVWASARPLLRVEGQPVLAGRRP